MRFHRNARIFGKGLKGAHGGPCLLILGEHTMKQHQIARFANIFLCLLLLSACNPTKADPGRNSDWLDPKFDTTDLLPQYDQNNSWMRPGNIFSCATEDTLYFSYGSEYIYYCDLATGINGPLCGKPECPHTNRTCNAYTGVSTAAGLSVYDGKLYWIDLNAEHIPTIYCMDLDGTNRVAVCSFDLSLYQTIKGNRLFAFHRGYMISGGKSNIVSEGSARYGIFVYAVSLSTGEETIIFDQTFEEGVAPEIRLVPYRNKLYLIMSCQTPVDDRWETSLIISEWSLKTHEIVSLYDQSRDFLFLEAWATEDNLLLSSALDGNIYKFDLFSNEMNLLFDLNAEGKEYSRTRFVNDYLVNWNLTEKRIPHIHVTDPEGRVVYSEDLDLPDWPSQGFGYDLMGADHDNLYIQLTLRIEDESLGKTWRRIEIAQVPLNGGGTVRELWSLDREQG